MDSSQSAEVNLYTGGDKSELSLLQLEERLSFRPGEENDLKLRDGGRRLIFKGALRSAGNDRELLVFLFDHVLLMAKQKEEHGRYEVYNRPIPLELLYVTAPNETVVTSGARHLDDPHTHELVSLSHAPRPLVMNVKVQGSIKNSYPLAFVHLGRKGHRTTLWAETLSQQKEWLEHVTEQQEMKRRNGHLEMENIGEGFFVGANAINCAALFDQGRQIIYGTNEGIYLSDPAQPLRKPAKVLALTDVSQVDLLEEYGLLIVLSEGVVMAFTLDALDPIDPLAGLKRAKRIASHATFLSSGTCLDQTFVCVIKTGLLSSTVKVFKPIEKLLQAEKGTLQIHREFYIPMRSSSIHFLRTRLCVACENGFSLVDLESLEMQELLDSSDDSFGFIRQHAEPTKPKPVAIYRIDDEFLLCYNEFAFYIDRSGRRSRRDFLVYWEGKPTGFALRYPYLLAFDARFVEIRHAETGALAQVVQGNNIRALFAAEAAEAPSQIIVASDDRVLSMRLSDPRV